MEEFQLQMCFVIPFPWFSVWFSIGWYWNCSSWGPLIVVGIEDMMLAMYLQLQDGYIKHVKPCQTMLKLVGGLEHVLFFHIYIYYILGIVIPTDFHIFQRGCNHQPVNHV